MSIIKAAPEILSVMPLAVSHDFLRKILESSRSVLDFVELVKYSPKEVLYELGSAGDLSDHIKEMPLSWYPAVLKALPVDGQLLFESIPGDLIGDRVGARKDEFFRLMSQDQKTAINTYTASDVR